MARKGQYTIFDRLEDQGYFSSNPANIFAKGPSGENIYQKQDFPVMVYHPKGELQVVQPAEVMITPFGPREVNEKSEMIHALVESPEGLEMALAAGWHLDPADATEARTGERPAPPKPRLHAQFVARPSAGAPDPLSAMAAMQEQMRQMMAEMQALRAVAGTGPGLQPVPQAEPTPVVNTSPALGLPPSAPPAVTSRKVRSSDELA